MNNDTPREVQSTTTDVEHPVGSGQARPGRLRAKLFAGLAAGALLVAAPVTTATAVAAASPATAQTVFTVSGQSSSLPETITLTTRRTGSVIL